jgi:hypothetical protein
VRERLLEAWALEGDLATSPSAQENHSDSDDPYLNSLHHEHSLNLTRVLAILPFGNSAHDWLIGNFTIQLMKHTLFKTSNQ